MTMWRVMKKLISGLTSVILFITLIGMGFAVILNQVVEGEPNFFGYQIKTVLS
ncbi:hypothetical protein ACDX78_08005 [Virgibacillus oceani]